MSESPVRAYKALVLDSGTSEYMNRLLVGTACTGLLRVEWYAARTSQIIPCNWSQVTLNQFMSDFMPLRYQVADAQNLIVREAVGKDFEWLLLYEHDVLPPADAFVRLNQYIIEERTPIVSGLYFSRSRPSEPLVFRGRGTGYHAGWRLGDRVWCDGLPTGFLLVHVPILRLMWEESPEYAIRYGTQATLTRRVFDAPRKQWADAETQSHFSMTGTSDLNWCARVVEGDYIRRAGWTDYWEGLEDERWPLLVDTGIFCRHIDPDGTQYPLEEELARWR